MHEDYQNDPLTERVMGFAIEVHRQLGPGLLEPAYEECLSFELKNAPISFKRQVPLPVIYKSVRLDCGYRLDLIVEDRLILELKTVEKLPPVHEAQMLTYLKLREYALGCFLTSTHPC